MPARQGIGRSRAGFTSEVMSLPASVSVAPSDAREIGRVAAGGFRQAPPASRVAREAFARHERPDARLRFAITSRS